MSKYVLTTGTLLEIYRGYRRRNRGLIGSAPPHRQIEAEFDRWLAGVKADAWEEGAEAGAEHITSGHPGDLSNPYEGDRHVDQ